MIFRPILLIVGAAATGLLALSCGGGEPEAPISAEAMKEAQAIYTAKCTACHGASGTGDGVNAAALNPKPRNYTDKAWQKSVFDDYLAKAIVGGGPAVGKSALMPPNPELADKPEVVRGLVKIVRDFAK